MSDIFRKLNLKNQEEILVLNAPTSFEPELASLTDVAIRRSVDSLQHIVFSLAFVTKQAEVDELARAIARRAQGDAIVWFAYPKASSKNYTCEFNRDTGWAVLGELGFEGVRQVAIDEDWSALRFRRVEFIKTMTRAKQRRLTERNKE
ncbi:MAG: hypothetical protein ACFLMY_17940 [Candidatus Brachytrichaceae bacterium NZ_4S206]|jgi:hypothetical protein